MIEFNILESSNINAIGKYKFFHNLIYIGSNDDADLIINEKDIVKNHCFVEVADNQLIIHPHKEIDYYLLNNKKTNVYKQLPIGTKVQIGSTIIEFTSFSHTIQEYLEEGIQRSLEHIKIKAPDLYKIIKEESDERSL